MLGLTLHDHIIVGAGREVSLRGSVTSDPRPWQRGRGGQGVCDRLAVEREALGACRGDWSDDQHAENRPRLVAGYPFQQPGLSQSNVRRVKAGISVDELARSIARRGLIQSLHVRAVIGEDRAETGKFSACGRAAFPGSGTAGEAKAPCQDRHLCPASSAWPMTVC